MDEKKSSPGQLVIITGMSGAGKTVAVQCFEDLGYYCIDNLPPILLPKFLELMNESDSKFNKVAMVMDLRGREFFEDLIAVLDDLRVSPIIDTQVLFLEADNETLVNRYKETRRTHPLAPNELPMKGIEKERELLSDLKGMAKNIYDTSLYKPKELREKIMLEFGSKNRQSFQIQLMSFGYKHGIPIESDIVFDVRFLPNPFYIEEMRSKTGLDQEVADYVLKWKESQQFLEKLIELLDITVPFCKKEGKAQLIISIGCTGGQHRSVAISEYIKKHFTVKYPTHIFHRDIQKKKVTLHE